MPGCAPDACFVRRSGARYRASAECGSVARAFPLARRSSRAALRDEHETPSPVHCLRPTPWAPHDGSHPRTARSSELVAYLHTAPLSESVVRRSRSGKDICQSRPGSDHKLHSAGIGEYRKNRNAYRSSPVLSAAGLNTFRLEDEFVRLSSYRLLSPLCRLSSRVHNP
jgi:hypothetical protein